ncbi:NAD(P)-dependent oxidoreductase [uncultured Marivirga sp.]|uniref:NAD-dependent epimerase/dehydratase family protein n=1 Tax=uncultured Marivirga sp. TaxID=1123707 RepID=UPI0030EF5E23|tara:strand:+ start:122096 stop:123091 length:996 start_codon:yes stop_codon:yes gene_type:complete
MKKTVLLIGGAGYVGTVITSHFLKLGYKVRVLDNFVYDNQNSIQAYLGDPDYSFTYGDFAKTADLEKVSQGVDDVVILGGLVGDPITKKYPEASEKINDEGIKTCINFFDNQPINKLIFISTCSNYGLIKEDELADENFELNPLSLYAKAKVGAEKHLLGKKGKANYTGVVLRFATAFGLSPRMRFDLSVSEFVRDLFFGEELLVFDEHTWRPYCHVRDFARLIDLVISASNEKVNFEVFNAGGDVNNFTKKMIVDTIQKHIPNAKIKFGEKGSDPRNYKVSFNKVKEVLDFEPRFLVEDGIKELTDALKVGIYKDSLENKSKYGNYEIEY